MPLSNRRQFLTFIGATCSLPFLSKGSMSGRSITQSLPSIRPSIKDDLVLAKGFQYSSLISWKDRISDFDTFGFNCDYTAFIEQDKNTGILWVNHEYINPLFIHGSEPDSKTKKQVQDEMYNMGGSLLEVYRKNEEEKWKVKNNSSYNKRITALTKIPFANNIKVKGSKESIGMVANCAGGITPWNTILTCEENFDSYHGKRKKNGTKKPGRYQWEKFYDQAPEHYGWVVEVNPLTAEAKKHTSLGRFSHECATPTYDAFGNLVVYSGDDSENEFVYKFISDKKDSLDTGKLYVANLKKGKWISLDINDSPELKKTFKTNLDVLINCRRAGKIVGATPLDRPEDIEIHPITGDVFICLSNNKDEGNFHGSILKITESKKDSLSFNHETFMAGGDHFSCPDNLTFDRNGNIWLCCDISGKRIGKDPYQKYGNNGLFFIPTTGAHAGKVLQIGSAPNDAEFTGTTLSPDGKTLFLSVQHPGELSKSIDELTSNWPENVQGKIPRPTVVQITGPLLI